MTFSRERLVFAPTAVVAPVPPLVMATVPVTLAALPAISPETFEPLTPAILASVTAAVAILAVVTASAAISGAVAIPVKSPASCIFPVAVVVASGEADDTVAST